MRVEVLVAAMNQDPHAHEYACAHEYARALAERMRLESDAVIIDQCDRLGCEEWQESGHRFRCWHFPERGVGRSRNEAILRADGDICLFSDEDIVYEPGYAEAIAREFERNPRADLILFNIEVEEARRTYHIEERKRVHWYNCGRYGAVSFAVRRESLLSSGVMFSLLFGGGARYSNGEDSLFLKEFMHRGYRVYTAPVVIGRESASESSWFAGYNEKFFRDRGVLYRYLYGALAGAMAVRFLVVHRDKLCQDVTLGQAYRWMREGYRRTK